MKAKTKARIAELTAAGKHQTEIARALRWYSPGARNKVGRVQAELGLSLKRHGPRCPSLSEAEKTEVLRLLPTMGYQKVAARLNLREHAVRQLARQNGFGRRPLSKWALLPPEIQAKVIEEIKLRTNFVTQIAAKYGLCYKFTLKLAHGVRGTTAFELGCAGPPMESPLPQLHFQGELST